VEQIASTPGILSIVRNNKIQVATAPEILSTNEDDIYVTATEDPFIWDFVSPASVVMGADKVHKPGDGSAGVTGANVTIAVIDSGIHFN